MTYPRAVIKLDSIRAPINEAEHGVFPRPLTTYVLQVPSPELRAYKSESSLIEQ